MAGRYGYASLSRSLMSATRRTTSTSFRSPPSSLPRIPRYHPSFSPSRNLGSLGCTSSFLPFTAAVVPKLTSHCASISVRACCELTHGTFCRTCPDR